MNPLHRRAILAAGAASVFAGAARARARLDRPAPPFSVVTFDGRTVSLDQLRGQVVLLNYWATWCAPCRVELPVLATYFRKHAARGLQMFAIKDDSDSRPDRDLAPLSRIVPFLAKRLNGRGYGSIDGAVPSNYVIDRDGVLRYARPGAFTAGDLDAVVTPLLDAQAPAEASAI